MTCARLSRFVVAGFVVLGAGALTGCSAVNPITTDRPYNASDGIRVTLGTSFTAENLLIISAEEGDPGALIGGLTNRGSTNLVVTLAADGAQDVTVAVPAGVTVLLGSESNEPVELDAVDVPPGATLPVTISTPEGGSEQISIPVLDGTFAPYATLVPTPTPTPTA